MVIYSFDLLNLVKIIENQELGAKRIPSKRVHCKKL